MHELKIKASGHILERDFLGQLYEALRGRDCDVTDIEIFCPTLKGGWREQCPSVIIFKLVPEIEAPGEKDVEECYGLLRDVMRQLGCRLIYRKEIAYGPPVREVGDESYLQHPE